MTPSEKLQLQEALIKYKQTHGIKGQHYWLTILEKLDLPTEKRVVDGEEIKPALHERDPRNWITDGIEPGPEKLGIYLDFIRSVNPDFKFRGSLTEEYIQIGLTLARFSVGQAAADDPKLHRQAKNLSGSLFLSKSYQESDDYDFCRVLFLQAVPGSPFLLAKRFCITNPATPWSEKNAFLDSLLTYMNSDHYCAHENLRRFVTEFDKVLPDLVDRSVMSIKTIYKGILAPNGLDHYYHGILQSSNFLPDHVGLRFISEDGDRMSLASEVSHYWPSPAEYVRCEGTNYLASIFSSIEEPRI